MAQQYTWQMGGEIQPNSYFSDPMSSNIGDPSDMNPYAQTGLDLLAGGLSRLIDVQTVRALQGTNTVAVLQSPGLTVTTAGNGYVVPSGPVAVAGTGGRGMLLVLAVGALFLMLEGEKG